MKMVCNFCPSIGGSVARVKSVRRHDCGVIIPSGCYTVITQNFMENCFLLGKLSKSNRHSEQNKYTLHGYDECIALRFA